MNCFKAVSLVFGVMLLPACVSPATEPASSDRQADRSSSSGPAPPIWELGPTEADYPSLLNLKQFSEQIYSGGEPETEESFKALKQLGVKTVVSVDGARPEVALAEKYGLRYVHIPIGYDAIPEKAKLSLARLMRETSEPIYVHCHHGRHRGPAAAAVACQAAGQADSKLATQMLEAAGTGKHYTGLWRDVSRFTPVPETTEYPDLVSVAEVDSLSAMMAKVDRNLDHLETMQESDWQPPPNHPDLDPAQETLMMQERFREAERLLDDSYDAQFRRWLKSKPNRYRPTCGGLSRRRNRHRPEPHRFWIN